MCVCVCMSVCVCACVYCFDIIYLYVLTVHSFNLFSLFLTFSQLIRDIVVNAPVTCTCHGVSGSCTFQTCHSELPDFSYIADKIKKKYSEACKVTPNSHSENTWVSECGHDFTEHDLIYREENDWCVINPSIGSVGVSGRECEVHSDGSNSCENLCTQCGSRPIEQTENIERENKCSFHFCCEIRCTVVKGQKTYHTCS